MICKWVVTNARAGSIVVRVGGSVGAGVLLVFGGAASGLIVLGAASVHRAGITGTLQRGFSKSVIKLDVIYLI